MNQQKCKSCGKSIDVGLVVCPFCDRPPGQAKEQDLSPIQVKQLAREVRKQLVRPLVYWLSILSLIVGVGLLQVYLGATSQLRKLLVQRISTEFDQPKIRETVQDVAAKDAKELLIQQIQPEVDKFKSEVAANQKKIVGLVESAQTELGDLTTLMELEDAARFGSRSAFLKLIQLGSCPDLSWRCGGHSRVNPTRS